MRLHSQETPASLETHVLIAAHSQVLPELAAAPVTTYGALARFSDFSGAEWSLFCPGSGIALDSCAGVIALLDRPGAASALGASVAGATTESAGGTVLFAAGDCCVAA